MDKEEFHTVDNSLLSDEARVVHFWHCRSSWTFSTFILVQCETVRPGFGKYGVLGFAVPECSMC